MTFTRLLPSILLSCLVSASAAAATPKLAILDVKATMVPQHLGGVLTEILTAEVAALGAYEVVASSDVSAMVGFEKQKELAGCTDATCLADIGGALGVELIIVSDVAAVGTTYVVNVKLMNIRTARVESRIYETVKGTEDVLIETMKTAVCRLLPGRGSCHGAAASDSAPVEPLEKQKAAPPRAEPEALAKVEPERPASASPAAAQGETSEPGFFGRAFSDRRYGLFLGVGRGRVQHEVTYAVGENTHEIRSEQTFPLTLFFQSRLLDLEIGGSAPISSDVAVGSASLLLKPWAGIGMGVRLMDMYERVFTADEEYKVESGVKALMAGISYEYARAFRLSVFVGPKPSTWARLETKVLESGITTTRNVEYDGTGGAPAFSVDLQYFVTDHLGLRLGMWNGYGDGLATDKYLGSAVLADGDTRSYHEIMYFHLGVGYDFAGLFEG